MIIDVKSSLESVRDIVHVCVEGVWCVGEAGELAARHSSLLKIQRKFLKIHVWMRSVLLMSGCRDCS